MLRFFANSQILWIEKGCFYCVYCDNSCSTLNLCALFRLDAVSSDAFRVADEKSNFGLFHLLRCLRQLRAGHCFNRPIIGGSPPMLLNSLVTPSTPPGGWHISLSSHKLCIFQSTSLVKCDFYVCFVMIASSILFIILLASSTLIA